MNTIRPFDAKLIDPAARTDHARTEAVSTQAVAPPAVPADAVDLTALGRDISSSRAEAGKAAKWGDRGVLMVLGGAVTLGLGIPMLGLCPPAGAAMCVAGGSAISGGTLLVAANRTREDRAKSAVARLEAERAQLLEQNPNLGLLADPLALRHAQ